MKNIEGFGPVLLVLISLGVAIYFGYVATTRTLTGPESFLWQAFALGVGLLGSFIFGRRAAGEAAREVIQPHARSAFRRLRALYGSLSRAAYVIESSQNSQSSGDYQIALAKLEAIVKEQLTTADDALEDWRDIVPEDVEELRKQISPGNPTRDRP